MTSTADPTDPGTRRPVEPAIVESEDNFEAVERPLRKLKITCSAPDNAYSLFALFFPDEQLQKIADNTNKKAKKQESDPINRREQRGGGQNLGGLLARDLFDTTVAELYAYFAIKIYTGIHKQNQIRDYRKVDHRVPNHPMVYKAMALNPFEQLQRYFHPFDPETNGPAHTKVKTNLKNSFVIIKLIVKQVEPLNCYILKQSTVYWDPGTDVAVDEAMTRFTGRSSDIVTIPCKPIATGYKIWVIAQLGYSLSWIFHQKQKGPVNIKKVPKGLNKTSE